MSWMDSWSRPNKSQAVPAPYYLLGDAKYCHTCGRIIGSRRSNTSKSSGAEVKFCSDRCKRTKPSTAEGSLEVHVEAALLALLEGRPPPPIVGHNAANGTGENGDAAETTKAVAPVKVAHKAKKGDPRIIITLSELEMAVFGDRKDPEKTYGRRKNRAYRGVKEGAEWKSVDMVDAKKSPGPPTEEMKNASLTDEDEDDSDDYSDSGSGDYEESDDEPSTSDKQGGVLLSATDGPSSGVASRVTKHKQPPDMIPMHVRPAQTDSDVNFSVGGERGWSEKIAETPEMLAKRREGQKRAEEKEFVKRVARRAVVFGLLVDAPVVDMREKGGKGKKGKRVAEEQEEVKDGEKVRRKCEAIMQGSVVEPSFAKGDWSIRWRED